MVYGLLGLAIATEVTATLMLKASNGWERWGFGVGSIVMYGVAAYVLGHVLSHMNVGLAYTIWSGAGIGLVCIATVTLFGQRLDAWALAGIALIFIGTLLITLKSGVAL